MTDLPAVAGGLVGTVVAAVPEAAGHVVVGVGQTVSSVADSVGVSVGALLQANPQVLHPDLVSPGQRLALPPSSSSAPAPAPSALPSGPTGAAAPVVQAAGEALGGTGGIVQGVAAAVAGPQAAPSGSPAPTAALATVVAAGASPPLASPPGAAPALAASSASLVAEPGSAPADLPAADWRVLAQAVSGSALVSASVELTALPPALAALVRALAPLDPLMAQLLALGGARVVLLIQVAERLAQPLAQTGWAGLLEVAGRGGDVMLTATARGFAAEAFPSALPDAGGRLVLRPADGAPVGIDLPAVRRRFAGGDPAASDRASRKGKQSGGDEAESPQRRWIDRALGAALGVKARWGVPAAVTLAQGAVASDWGRVAPGNDFFGLHSASASASAQQTLPALPGASAPAFDGVDDAADAWGRRLREVPAFARAFKAGDPVEVVARAAASLGPAAPRWAPTLQAVMELNGLLALDA